MKILALDSSSLPVSVALLEDTKVLLNFFANVSITHSQTLLPILDSALSITNIPAEEIDLVAVSHGPGSFTGLRIAISSAKAIAMALNIPCLGVSTLESLAYNLQGKDCIAVAVMDARREHVYNAIFKVEHSKVIRFTEDRLISIRELWNELNNYTSYGKDIIFVGDASEICYQFRGINNTKFKICLERYRFQNASSVAMIANETDSSKYLRSDQLVPNYLRLSQAERELKQKRGQI